jgi:small ligand-binding sensory domain FIST
VSEGPTAEFGAALSEHPLATHATGEVVGELLETLGSEPDLALVFVTAAHLGALDDVVATVKATLGARTVLGATTRSVLGGRREVEGQPAVAAWAARGGRVTPVRLMSAEDWPDHDAEPGSTLVLLSDPDSFAARDALDTAAQRWPGVTVVGGPASAPTGPGGNRLSLDGRAYTEGAVGALLGPQWPLRTVVSQGCRPIGDPYTVTRAERSMVHELAGQPAMARLGEVVRHLSPDERTAAAQSLHLGWLVDEHKLDLERGDFLVRPIQGADPDTGSIAIPAEIEVGATVQFHVRDATSADEDLRAMLAGTPAAAALLFVGVARGLQMFGTADHDAKVVSTLTESPPSPGAFRAVRPMTVAGMFTAAPVGPVGTRSFVHPPEAAVALLAGTSAPPPVGPDLGEGPIR